MNKQYTPKTLPRFRRKPLITALESRILLDGAAVATVVEMTTDVAFQQDVVHQPAPDQAVHFSDGSLALAPTQIKAGDPSQNQGRKEVAFVDSSVEDYQTLVDGIGAGIEVQLIDGSQDGLAQLAVWAQQNSGYDAIHILSHGEQGQISLGTLTLNTAVVDARSAELANLGAALTADGDLLLYGCEVTSEGSQTFVTALAAAAGADVAASEDLTGTQARGGDWQLEYHQGDIETEGLNVESYDGVLAEPVQVSVFSYPGLNGSGAQTDDENANLTSIIQAQIDGGANYTLDTSITSFTDPALADKLAASGFFFMTDMENQDPTDIGFFPESARTIFRDWVNEGGVIMMTGTSGSKDADFLNLIFDWDLTSVSSSSQILKNDANVAGTPFEDAEASYLNAPSATDAINKGTVENFTAMYGTDTQAVVAVIEYGAGYVIYMGFDFYDAGTQGSQYSNAWVQEMIPAGMEYAAMLADSGDVDEDGIFIFPDDAFQSGEEVLSQVKITSLPSNGTLTLAGSAVSVNQVITSAQYSQLSYTPEANFNGEDGFNWQGYDGEAYSADIAYELNVGAVNDAPILDTAPELALTTIDEDLPTADNLGTSVSDIVADGSITDIDGAIEAMAVSAVDNSNGTWQYKVGSGAWMAFDFSGSNAGKALLLDSTDSIRFLADTDFNGTVTEGITFYAWDTSRSRAGSYLTIDGNSGGEGTLSANTDSAAITVSSINDAPNFGLPLPPTSQTAIGEGIDRGYSVVAQSDGKLLVVGYSWNGSDDDIVLVRYNSNGSLDTSFGGGNGYVRTGISAADLSNTANGAEAGDDFGYSVTVQGDGKILVSGKTQVSNGNSDVIVLRYNSDGSLDSSFGSDGVAVIDAGSSSETSWSISEHDGNIVVAISGHSRVVVAQLTATGELDSSFGSGGLVTTDVSGSSTEYAYRVAHQPDGKIVVAGVANGTDVLVLRYNDSGVLDSTFGGGDGIVTASGMATGGSLSAPSLALQDDGKIVVAGYAESNVMDWMTKAMITTESVTLVRFTEAGVLDTGFGTNGMVTNTVLDWSEVKDVAVQADGTILVAGNRPVSGNGVDFVLARFTGSGTLDTTFGDSGQINTDIGNGNNYVSAMTLLDNGALVLVGSAHNGSDDDIAVAHYNSDGSLNTDLSGETLGGTVNFTENGSAVVLDNDVEISDAELDDSHYAGATLTIERNGGASAEDNFSATGTLGTLAEGDNLTVNGTVIGIITVCSGGTLTFTFNANATQNLINEAMRQIAYTNDSDTPPASVQLDWRFADGNAGEQGSGGELAGNGTVTVAINAVNDEPTLTATASNPAFNAGSTAISLFSDTNIDTFEEGQTIKGITLTVSNLADGADEIIKLDGTDVVLVQGNSGTSANNSLGYSVSVSGGTATITLTGGTLSTVAAQTLIDNISYQNNSDAPTSHNRVVTLTRIQDSGGTANAGDDTATLAISSTVMVLAANSAPIAMDDSGTAIEAGGVANGSTGTDATGNVLSNDSDVDDGDTKTVTGVEFGETSDAAGAALAGNYGSLTLNANGSYSYVIDENNAAVQALRLSGQTLTETFGYTVTDAAGATDSATLTITLEGRNDAPVATNDTATAVEAGGVVNGTAGSNASGNVLTNDSDVDTVANGETKAVTTVEFGEISGTVGSVLNGQYGSLTLNANGSYSYVIDENNAAVQALRLSGQTLSETFSYTVTDAAGATDSATLTITLEGRNDAPVATNDTATAVEAGGVANGSTGTDATGNVLSNDSDVDDGDTKTVTGVEFGETSDAAGAALAGNYGSLTLNANGSYSYVIDENNAAVQALRLSGQTLTETFGYTVTDAAGASDTATLTITIEGSNDAPVATNDTATAVEAGGVANGSTGTDATGNVLSNDSDVDSVANGETKVVTTVEFGDTSGTVGSVLNGQYGSLTLNEDGSYSYVIDENNAAVQALRLSGQTLTETFSYTVTDAAGATDTATLTITLEGSNDAPVATNDTATAVETGGVANGTAGSDATGNVLSNDSDVDSVANGETKAVTTVEFGEISGTVGSVLNGQYGSLTLNEDGSYSYVIDENNAAVQALRLSGQTLSESFGYTVTDAAGATDTATLTITIEGRNDAPVALTTNIDEQWSFGKDYQRDISVLFTDMDSAANGEDLDFVIKGLPKGLSYNPETGIITGKPTESGKFVVTLTAVDQAGAEVSRVYQLEVLAPPQDTPIVKPVTNNDVPPFQRDNTSVTNELSSLPQGLINKDSGSDSTTGAGFVTPRAPVETVLLSESGALVVQTTGTDGNITVRAAVDVNVSDNGEVVFTEVQQQAFDTVALRVSSITTGADNDISIGIADSNAEPGQRYSGALADGTALPDWIIIDPKTGDVSLRSPGDVKELTLRIQAVGSDGQTRILEIKLNIEELQRNQATGSADQPAADVAATGFVPLAEQLAIEVDTVEGYGHRLLTMLTVV